MKRFFIIMLLFITGCADGVDLSEVYSEGSAAFNEKKFDVAEKLFTSVIKQDKEFLNAYLMLAKIYYYNRDYKKSIDSLEEIIERDPDHSAALYWKSRSLVMSDNNCIDEPVSLLKKVIETDSSHTPARLLLALLYEKKGAYKEALHEYAVILNEEENIVNARGNLAILYSRLGLSGRAKSEIEKACKIAEISGCGSEQLKHIRSEIDQCKN